MEFPHSALAPVLLVAVLYGCASTSPVAPPESTSPVSIQRDSEQNAPRMSVTYFTDPPNGSLYGTSGIYGPTPLTLQYDIPAHFDACVELEGLQVVWASGATQTVELRACPGDAMVRQHTVTRPALPGREVDLWYATRVADLGLLPGDEDSDEDSEEDSGGSRSGTVVASKR